MKNKYKVIKLRRLYQGYASIRSYELVQAMHARQGLRVYLEPTGECMTIEYKDFHKGVDNGVVFESKRNRGQKYTLVDFDWHPDSEAQQLSLIKDNKQKVRTSAYGASKVSAMQHIRLEDLREILYGKNSKTA